MADVSMRVVPLTSSYLSMKLHTTSLCDSGSHVCARNRLPSAVVSLRVLSKVTVEAVSVALAPSVTADRKSGVEGKRVDDGARRVVPLTSSDLSLKVPPTTSWKTALPTTARNWLPSAGVS